MTTHSRRMVPIPRLEMLDRRELRRWAVQEQGRTDVLRGQSFGQLDVGPPWVAEKCDLHLAVGHLPDRRVDLDPSGFEALHELLEVSHVEADVIQRATLRRDDRRPGSRK